MRRLVRLAAAGLAAAVLAVAAASGPAAAGEADPSSGRTDASRKHFEDAEVMREEGKWAEAARSYARAVELDPSCFACHVRLQQAAARAGEAAGLAARYERLATERPGDPGAALHRLRLAPPAARAAALERTVAANPKDVDALRELGRAHAALGDHAHARKAFEAAYALRPSDRELLLLSVEALQATGDAPGALARLEQALRDDSETWDAHLGLARIHLVAGRTKEAVERADAVLALRPTHLAAMILKAEGLSRLQKPDEALKTLDAALAVNAQDVEARIAWADLEGRKGSEEAYKRALASYGKVLAVDRTNARAHYGVAWVNERMGAFGEAEKSYREALLSTPADAAVVNSLGLVLLRQKKFQDAVVQFKKAVDLDPVSPAAYLNLGATYDEQSQWSEAIAWYGRCLKLKGQDKNVRALLASAFDHESLGAYAKAEDFLVKVRGLRPDDSDVASFLGDNQAMQRKWKIAVKHYQDATRLDAKNRFAWRGLGAALVEDGKPDEAIAALEKARALKADDPNVLYLLGDLYYREKDDLEKALAALEGYVKAGGADADVPALIQQIKSEIEERKK